MPNERTTEELVRLHLKKNGVPGQIIEEQTSDDPKIKRALAKASKSGEGIGKPEFLVRLPGEPDFLIVFECKVDASKHESKDHDKPALFAVDGVLVYSAHLSKDFDVVSVAVSGTNAKSLKVSTFRQLRGTAIAEPLLDEHGEITELCKVAEYLRLLNFDPAVRRRTQEELMKFGRDLHNWLRAHAKLSENEKPLAVSGVLLALRDEAFQVGWRKYKRPETLSRELLAALKREIDAAVSETSKRKVIIDPYRFLETHPELNRIPPGQTEWPLRSLVGQIEENVRPFIDTYRDVDVIGQFYGEFLRYSGGDKKGLGIVLTPRHLTELFVKMASVSLTDTVVDTCCGTGGFLIAALAEMDRIAAGDEQLREDVREHRLVGVEQTPHMFALAASNMILRGDGKANLFQGTCFDEEIIRHLKDPDPDPKNLKRTRYQRPTVGLINPPFAQADHPELDFTKNLLDVLAARGRGVVVLPMSCATEPSRFKGEILAEHTLVAAVSLPNDLFTPAGVVPCAFVFEAHRPHAQSPTPTWFAQWKDDGFIKRKQHGRIDYKGKWRVIRDEWLVAFHSKAVVPGKSVLRTVGAGDEWCAEAYLEPDYGSISKKDFEAVVREYAIFEAIHGGEEEEDSP